MTGETQNTATTVEWGGRERRGRLATLVTGRWRRAAVLALAGLGALAVFGSLVGDWQVIDDFPGGPGPGTDPRAFGIGVMHVWGIWWLVSATVLLTCVVLALSGEPAVRTGVRTIGLAAGVVLLVFLVAASISLSTESIWSIGRQPTEIGLGQGVHLAFAAVVLLLAALWWSGSGWSGSADDRDATPPRRRGWWGAHEREDRVHGPHDLSVQPATPDTLQG